MPSNASQETVGQINANTGEVAKRPSRTPPKYTEFHVYEGVDFGYHLSQILVESGIKNIEYIST